jgi:hypothetical protein
MPQVAKESVDVTSLLKGILNGYPGSSAILREYLQNSDDAKANLQVSFVICLTVQRSTLKRFSFWMKHRIQLHLLLTLSSKIHKDLP